MVRILSGALALAASTSLAAQTTTIDLTYASPIAGSWRYMAVAGGSEATFATPAGAPQLTIRCGRATRAVSILRPASAASASLWIWTSLQARTVPAGYDAATARIAATLSAFDGILDAMALSRGRIGIGAGGATPLVVPAWGDIARVVEDCRG